MKTVFPSAAVTFSAELKTRAWVWPIVLKPVNTRQKQPPSRKMLIIFIVFTSIFYTICPTLLKSNMNSVFYCFVATTVYKLTTNKSLRNEINSSSSNNSADKVELG